MLQHNYRIPQLSKKNQYFFIHPFWFSGGHNAVGHNVRFGGKYPLNPCASLPTHWHEGDDDDKDDNGDDDDDDDKE